MKPNDARLQRARRKAFGNAVRKILLEDEDFGPIEPTIFKAILRLEQTLPTGEDRQVRDERLHRRLQAVLDRESEPDGPEIVAWFETLIDTFYERYVEGDAAGQTEHCP